MISLADNQPKSPPFIEEASSEYFLAASSKVIRLFEIDFFNFFDFINYVLRG